MDTARPIFVDGLNALVARLGHRQMGTPYVSVTGGAYTVVPTLLDQRRPAKQNRGIGLNRVGFFAVDRLEFSSGPLVADIGDDRVAWQAEMEYFDRF